MRRAVISDIHGNLEALEAVLDDIRGQGIAEIFCLGDLVGYGPDPCECIDRVMETCRVVLMGDHDQQALSSDGPSAARADRVMLWTRQQLDLARDRANNVRRRAFLIARPSSHQDGLYLFVHGSPRNPLGEYVFPEDIYNRRKMERLFPLVDRYCVKGHTHVPGIFTDELQFFSSGEIGQRYTLGAGKRMIDVGSVGQPRDGDDRACYVILEEPEGVNPSDRAGARPAPQVTFRRVSYDLDTTIRKIRDLPD
jgi:diadenosine tetraphosphatase ApaH/serine/threonine PP2A family protein phosphatase